MITSLNFQENYELVDFIEFIAYGTYKLK